MKKILLYYHTTLHLKFSQIFYQFWYRVKWKYFNLNYSYKKEIKFNYDLNNWIVPGVLGSSNYNGRLNFTFLNQTKIFNDAIDWSFLEYGKLWNYHLQYMDYLLDERIQIVDRKDILIHLSEQITKKKIKLESYPLSLRLINTLTFVQKHSIQHDKINKAIGIQLSFLENNLEYHLLANHLLENYISLCFVYTGLDKNEKQTKYLKLLLKELDQQILSDGAHYERTPAYHAQILVHLLQLVYFLKAINQQPEILAALKSICAKMLAWYKVMTLEGKQIPLFNDSSGSNTPAYEELHEVANHCSIKYQGIKLKESGYRILANDALSLIVNFGNVNPSYQVGHSHADILHFVLYFKGKAILIDTGISTYEDSTERLLEKSTRMHNTVSFGDENQSQIWSSFRMAKRAGVKILEEAENKLSAEVKWHNGLIHKRVFTLSNNALILEDIVTIIPNQREFPRANFHFNYLVNDKVHLSNNEVHLEELQIQFSNYQRIIKENYRQSEDFNKQNQAVKISAYFTDRLKTVISWKL